MSPIGTNRQGIAECPLLAQSGHVRSSPSRFYAKPLQGRGEAQAARILDSAIVRAGVMLGTASTAQAFAAASCIRCSSDGAALEAEEMARVVRAISVHMRNMVVSLVGWAGASGLETGDPRQDLLWCLASWLRRAPTLAYSARWLVRDWRLGGSFGLLRALPDAHGSGRNFPVSDWGRSRWIADQCRMVD